MCNCGHLFIVDGVPNYRMTIESGIDYWRVDNATTWQNAWLHCASESGTLAVIDSQQVHDKLMTKDLLIL